MPKKYFYTDPLKAAWMFREFDFQYEHLADGNPAVWTRINDFHAKREFVLLPHCVEILQPKIGDVGLDSRHPHPIGCRYYNYIWNTNAEFAGSKLYFPNLPVKIIQRNGIAFFMPESEEVE